MRPLIVALAGLALFAPTASATRIHESYSPCLCDFSSGATDTFGIVIRADPGEVNRLTIRVSTKGILITDPGNTFTGRCRPRGDHSRFCPGLWEDGIAVYLGDGDDTATVNGGAGLHGGAGDDVLLGTDGGYTFDGGAGGDRMEAGEDAQGFISYQRRSDGVTVRLNDVPDDGTGGEGDDIRGGIESITGGAGDDLLEGGPATSQIIGGEGADVMRGGIQNESMKGGPGDDVIDGGAGNDEINGGTGTDLMRGGDGRDLVSYADAPGPVRVSIGDGPNDGVADETDDVAADMEDIYGGTGDDVLIGDDGPNRLDGSSGADRMFGRAGADRLESGGEADELEPGPGQDRVIAGSHSILRLADGEADRVRCWWAAPAIEFDSLDTFRDCASSAYVWSARGPDRSGRMRVRVACDESARLPCTGELTLWRNGVSASRSVGIGTIDPGRRATIQLRLRHGPLRPGECIGSLIVTTRPDVPTTTRTVDRNIRCRQGS